MTWPLWLPFVARCTPGRLSLLPPTKRLLSHLRGSRRGMASMKIGRVVVVTMVPAFWPTPFENHHCRPAWLSWLSCNVAVGLFLRPCCPWICIASKRCWARSMQCSASAVPKCKERFCEKVLLSSMSMPSCPLPMLNWIDVFVRGPMTQYDSIWLNMTQYDSIWLNMTQYDSIWLNMTQYDSIWLNMTQYDSIWLNMTQYDSMNDDRVPQKASGLSPSQWN